MHQTLINVRDLNKYYKYLILLLLNIIFVYFLQRQQQQHTVHRISTYFFKFILWFLDLLFTVYTIFCLKNYTWLSHITLRKQVFLDMDDLFANVVFTGSQKAVHISTTRKQPENSVIHVPKIKVKTEIQIGRVKRVLLKQIN